MIEEPNDLPKSTVKMPQDKQLDNVKLDDVLEKRRLDQALNAKEFAVLMGVSYSTAREWFRMPGFPVIRGVVFWGDFVLWRRGQAGLQNDNRQGPSDQCSAASVAVEAKTELNLFPRATKILAEAG